MNKEQKVKILQYRMMLNGSYGNYNDVYNEVLNEYAWGKINKILSDVIRSSYIEKPVLKKMTKFKLL